MWWIIAVLVVLLVAIWVAIGFPWWEILLLGGLIVVFAVSDAKRNAEKEKNEKKTQGQQKKKK